MLIIIVIGFQSHRQLHDDYFPGFVVELSVRFPHFFELHQACPEYDSLQLAVSATFSLDPTLLMTNGPTGDGNDFLQQVIEDDGDLKLALWQSMDEVDALSHHNNDDDTSLSLEQ